MGYFSYDCKECGHPLLSPNATDPGLNDWMNDAVVLTPRGERIFGSYDGYGRVDGYEGLDNTACLHRACWDLTGKPEWDHYNSVSPHSADQGFFFDDGAHDLIDPRIKEDREGLLRQGQEARTKRQYDAKARQVYEWIHDPLNLDEPAWKQRFWYHKRYEKGLLLPNKWYFTDCFHEKFQGDDANFEGTAEEARDMCAKHWKEFLASPECASLLVHAHKLREEAFQKHVEGLKKTGRYEVSWGTSRTGGDKVNGRKMYCHRFYIADKLTYETVATFDYEGTPKDFGEDDPDFDGNHSPAWEARVEENRAETRARKAKAEEEAKRLNDLWASEGWLIPSGVGT